MRRQIVLMRHVNKKREARRSPRKFPVEIVNEAGDKSCWRVVCNIANFGNRLSLMDALTSAVSSPRLSGRREHQSAIHQLGRRPLSRFRTPGQRASLANSTSPHAHCSTIMFRDFVCGRIFPISHAFSQANKRCRSAGPATARFIFASKWRRIFRAMSQIPSIALRYNNTIISFFAERTQFRDTISGLARL